jgi:excisionase family DNA binding protein
MREGFKYYSVPQVAKQYGISESTVRSMIQKKEIPFLMFRRRYVFRSDVLEQWENEQMSK